jgi:hypothetical protein
LFLKEIQEAKLSLNRNILVVQRYFESAKMSAASQDDDEVKEFLINTPYTC